VEFQSLTRDSNHSNGARLPRWRRSSCFNPSRGIAIIQTQDEVAVLPALDGFNPSRGIAIIQTDGDLLLAPADDLFQSLTRDSNHSNLVAALEAMGSGEFQSLARDSNHSNCPNHISLALACQVSIPHAG